MYKVLSYIQSYVKIKITGPRPQKFINICLRRRIAIWQLTQNSEQEFTMCMLASEYLKNVRSAAAKADVKVSVIKKNGLRYTLRRYKSRKLLMILSIFLCASFALLSSMVWNITVEGADSISRQKTETLVTSLGIKRGMFMSNINSRVLAEQLLTKQNNLCWVGVKKRGMTLCIEIEEGTYYESKTSEDIPYDESCDIAVSKDCVLSKVTIEQGKQKIQTGSTALKGQVVVSGEGKHAKAKIMGCVWYKAEVPIEKETTELVYTGKEKKETSLLVFGMKLESPAWKWLPWNWGEKTFESFDSVYSEKYFGKKGNFPIGTAQMIKKQTTWVTREMTKEEALMKARAEAIATLDAVIDDESKILNTKWEILNKNGESFYRVTAEVLEEVGINISPQNSIDIQTHK